MDQCSNELLRTDEEMGMAGNEFNKVELPGTPTSLVKSSDSAERLSISKEGELSENDDVIWVEFEPNDPRNPINFSRRKKWCLTIVASISSGLASTAASAYNLGFGSMIRDLNCTEFQATVGLSVYPLGFAVVPMLTASLSEEVGRRPLYLWTAIGYELSFVMIALAPNIQTVIAGRFLQGAFASTGATMVGGTVADIWSVAERGLPMAMFALAATICLGVGPIAGGWIEMNPNLEWKWINWVQMTWSGAFIPAAYFVLKETRSTIVLEKIAKQMRKKTGDQRYRARVEKPKLLDLMWISCTRPLRLVLTEPVVTSFSAWIGFLWGVLFCLLESVSGVFKTLHHFNVGQTGMVFITMSIGPLLGFATNLYQEKLYTKYYPTRNAEARLIASCFAAFLLPIGMFIYAWCSFPEIHWISLCIGITIYMWGTFVVYLCIFSYLADWKSSYGPYASSALAGQSLTRNLLAAVFPLFTQQMYNKLSYKWANTLFGCIALLMVPIPFVLFYYGPKIRMMSKFSRMAVESQKQ
ncbi:hypothetical protein AGABI2DRAFT_177549 [Agaricus bisporus var. bisporus H97]|uniref:hypothetical protein n=1 Tax=Agaricus bisporus var. bisporus (strain H97 / ATCC MYA-4626 / FGSC 10389) TaxID=936046 RepID=UPI00029F71A6|nr:hypothetical protein AGABI2DRAFT_177549 [Agaricus bisporus var. bisporus H97]EKV49633.1 hypothetical protein AGABI2DRAFT_177549 [Agaricus bisporus var. bisporus H97]